MEALAFILDHGENYARGQLLARNEPLIPLYRLFVPDAPDAHILCDERDDKLMVRQVRKLAYQLDAIAAMLICDAWAVTVDANETEGDPPNQDPRRRKVIVILATDGETIEQRVLAVIRDRPDSPVIDLPRDTSVTNILMQELIEGIIEPPYSGEITPLVVVRTPCT